MSSAGILHARQRRRPVPLISARRATSLFLGAALGLTGNMRLADACSFYNNVVGGGFMVAGRTENYPPIPRNAVFLWSSDHGEPPAVAVPVAVDTATGMPIMGRIVRPIYRATDTSVWKLAATFMTKTDELLPTGLVLSGLRQQSPPIYTTGDYVDENAPRTRPEIIEGGIQHSEPSDTCDAITSVRFTLAHPAVDDHTPEELLTYAVYLEKSAAEARTTSTPFVLVMRPPAPDLQLFSFVAHSWMDSPAYIAVSAIDFAGNEGPRSEVFELNGSGCSCHIERGKGSRGAAALPILAMVACVRRRARRKD